ncbi:MAG: STAS domain-containing protein, partial [Planctomycetota bacterium]
LVAVMFMVVIGTFEWSSLWILHRVPAVDAVVIVLVTAVTVVTDNLALAVTVGVIIAALAFAWKHATSVQRRREVTGSVATYYMHGSIFFASVTSFRDCFRVTDDPEEVIIDFADATVLDHSAIEAVAGLTERYAAAGKRVHLRHLSPECRQLLGRAKGIIDIDELTDPRYHVADDALA